MTTLAWLGAALVLLRASAGAARWWVRHRARGDEAAWRAAFARHGGSRERFGKYDPALQAKAIARHRAERGEGGAT